MHRNHISYHIFLIDPPETPPISECNGAFLVLLTSWGPWRSEARFTGPLNPTFSYATRPMPCTEVVDPRAMHAVDRQGRLQVDVTFTQCCLRGTKVFDRQTISTPRSRTAPRIYMIYQGSGSRTPYASSGRCPPLPSC